MTQVVSIKFKQDGRIYYFNPEDISLNDGDYAVVETSRGIECGLVYKGNHSVPDSKITFPLKKVIRKADEKDINRLQNNRKKEDEAFKECLKLIEAHKLEMDLTRVEYSFDSSKIIFYFTSEGRVDFRELVKDLAAKFHTRIELRQIGVRDEAKMLGGIGLCGQPFCCSRFLSDFQPVSIKMAKEQGLSLNPTKISGSCGRLMCCLKYEQDAYEHLISITPGVNSTVKSSTGKVGTVTDVNLITGNIMVKFEDTEFPVKLNRRDVQILSRGKKKKQPEQTEK